MAEGRKKTYQKPEISKAELREMLLKTNEQLAAANERLMQQEKERTVFFANLSHDLRASLAVIKGALELLEADAGKESEEILAAARKRLSFMERLIDDMFFLSRMDHDAHEIRLKEIDLRNFLEDYFFGIRADSRFQNRKLSFQLPEEFSEKVRIDPELILRVLDNLFTNALKYSEEGAEIALCAESKDRDGEILICVRDTGRGIGPGDLPHVFDRLYRGSRERTPAEGSSGLGLSIVKSIIEQHGGSVSCESEPGKGSSFFFTLPKPDGE